MYSLLANGIMDFLVAQKDNQAASEQEKRILLNSVFAPGSESNRRDESSGM